MDSQGCGGTIGKSLRSLSHPANSTAKCFKKKEQINKEGPRENNEPQTARVVVISSSQIYSTVFQNLKRQINKEGHVNKQIPCQCNNRTSLHVGHLTRLPTISYLPKWSPKPILCSEQIKTKMPISQSYLFSIVRHSIYQRTAMTKSHRLFTQLL